MGRPKSDLSRKIIVRLRLNEPEQDKIRIAASILYRVFPELEGTVYGTTSLMRDLALAFAEAVIAVSESPDYTLAEKEEMIRILCTPEILKPNDTVRDNDDSQKTTE